MKLPFVDQSPKPLRTTQWNAVGAVYGVLDAANRVVYVGQTDDLQRRIEEHLADVRHCMHRSGGISGVADVVSDPTERNRRESYLIREYNPSCNVQQPGR
jgi:predicted GIY-YIG superfamily endonuclease